MVSMIVEWVRKHDTLVKYGLISVFVTIIDVIVSRISESFTDEVTANTIGVFTGFVLQCLLCMNVVFKDKKIKTIIVFFITWLFGLGLADLIIYVVRIIIFAGNDSMFVFMVGKGASIVIPFFVLYYIRRKLLKENKQDAV